MMTGVQHAPVTLTGSYDYITLSGQQLTLGQVDLTTDVTGALPVANGGTGATDASTARTNLGLAIGTDVQAYDATLQSISGLGTAADRMLFTTGVDTWAEQTTTAYGRSLLTPANDVAARILLGLGTLATLNSIDISSNTNLAVTSPITLTGDTVGIDQSLLSVTASQVSDFTSASQTVGDARYLKLDASNDPLTGTLAIDIPSNTNLIKLVNNGTQSEPVIIQRNAADTGNVAGLDGNGRWFSVGSTSSGFGIVSSDLATTHWSHVHTTVAATSTNATGVWNINGASGQSIIFNSTGIDIDHIFRTADDDNALRIDGGLNTLAIGDSPASAKKLTISQSNAGTGNPTTLVIKGTQTAAAATTLKGATFELFMTHTSGSLSGANVTEFNWTASGNGGTTSTVEGLNFIGNVSTGAIVTTANYIHLYAPNVSGTLSTLNALKIDAGNVIFNDNAGNYFLRLEGQSLTHMIYVDPQSATENIAFLTTAVPNWQSMDRGIFIGNMTTAPTGNPSNGGFLYVDAGTLKWRGSSGTVTSIAVA